MRGSNRFTHLIYAIRYPKISRLTPAKSTGLRASWPVGQWTSCVVNFAFIPVDRDKRLRIASLPAPQVEAGELVYHPAEGPLFPSKGLFGSLLE